MPEKNEDLETWHTILEQRMVTYEIMKTKMAGLLDSAITKGANNISNDKLLLPYNDIEWNKLKLLKQERNFGVFNEKDILETNPQNLYLDEMFMKEK